MREQEILQTLDLPFPCVFSKLYTICLSPSMFRVVLSLAISQGEKKGRAETCSDYNRQLRVLSEPPIPASGKGPSNVVGYVFL